MGKMILEYPIHILEVLDHHSIYINHSTDEHSPLPSLAMFGHVCK